MSSKKNKQTIDDIINDTFGQIKNVIDANTIIGNTIRLANNIFIVPISRVSVGIVSGGGVDSKKKQLTTAGSTSGFTISPIGFIAINNNDITFISAVSQESLQNKLFDSAISLSEKLFEKLGEQNEK